MTVDVFCILLNVLCKLGGIRVKARGRWYYKDYSKMVLGERVQIDHMTVSKNGITCEHFQAWDRCSKFIHVQVYHVQVYSHAKSAIAKRFLFDLITKNPFKIRSIQVDGGSEFTAWFEQACADLVIPSIVLPPLRPPPKQLSSASISPANSSWLSFSSL